MSKKGNQDFTSSDAVYQIDVDGASYKIVLPNVGEDYIQTKIAKEALPYELEMLRSMQAYLSSGNLVIDVGANIGNHALYLSEVVGCQVVAFEPNKALVGSLQESLRLNGAEKRLYVEEVALGGSAAKGRFEKAIPDNLGAQRIVVGSGEIQIRELDEYDFDDPISLIKVDVEGMELEVVKGAQKHIQQCRPLIYCESQSSGDFNLLLEYLAGLDYFYWETFNATPTHLFVPLSHEAFSFSDLREAHTTSALKSYSLAKMKASYMKLKGAVLEIKDELVSKESLVSERDGMIEEQKKDLLRLKKHLNETQRTVEELNLNLETERAARLLEEKKCSMHYKDLTAARIEYESLNRDLQNLCLELNQEKKHRSIAEAKRSGHYEKLQRALLELNGYKKTRSYHFYRLLQGGLSIKGILFFPIRLVRIIFFSSFRNGKKSRGKGKVDTRVELARPSGTIKNSVAEISELRLQAGLIGWPSIPDEKKGLPVVMAIADEFTAGCFGEDVALVQPRPDNWRALFERDLPELVFIESAWKGNSGSWQYRIASYSNKPGEEVTDIVRCSRERGIPSVLWNKEDPVHHEKFMESAKQVDVIFTTDANMINSYKEKTGNQKVYALPFAAQPKLHFPAPLEGRVKKACFAGTWYGERHQARGDAMQWMLKAALPLGLDIFDRNFQTNNFNFPEEYHSSIRGGLPYEELCEEYRKYRVFLNVNSVVDSPTMFSRRVFELLASGTPVVSSYARGIEEMFGQDIVWLVNCESEAREAIHTLLNDEEEWRRRSRAGIRAVFSRHTYLHRLQYIYDICGIPWSESNNSSVCVVALAENGDGVELLQKFLEKQSINKITALAIGSITLVEKISEDSAIQVVNGKEGEFELKAFIEKIDCDFFACIDVRADYGSHYLEDLLQAANYANKADVWTKKAFGLEHSFVEEADLYGSLISKRLFCQSLPMWRKCSTLNAGPIYKIDSEGLSLRGQPSCSIVSSLSS